MMKETEKTCKTTEELNTMPYDTNGIIAMPYDPGVIIRDTDIIINVADAYGYEINTIDLNILDHMKCTELKTLIKNIVKASDIKDIDKQLNDIKLFKTDKIFTDEDLILFRFLKRKDYNFICIHNNKYYISKKLHCADTLFHVIPNDMWLIPRELLSNESRMYIKHIYNTYKEYNKCITLDLRAL